MVHQLVFRCLVLLTLLGVLQGTGQAPAQDPKPLPEVQALLDLGVQPAREFKWDEALRLYEDALKKAEELNDLYGQGLCWNRLGNTYYNQGNLLKARDSFEKAKEWYIKAGSKSQEIGMLGNLAILKDNMGYPDEARPIYLQLLSYYREADNDGGEARMLLNLAILENGAFNYAAALTYAQDGREAFRKVDEKRWEVVSLGEAANALKGLGKGSEAILGYEEVVRLSRERNLKSEEASGLGNLGTIYRIQGDLLKALDSLRQSLRLREETNNLRHRNTALTNLGIVYELLGQSRLAIDHLERAAEGAKAIGDRPSQATALNNLGVVLDQLGLDERATVVLNEGLELNRSLGNKLGQATALGTLGAIQRKAKRYDEALSSLSAALAFYRELGYREEEATLLDSIANVFVDQGTRHDDALANFKRALAIYAELGNKRFAAATYGNMARAQTKQGQLADAEESYRQCVAFTEDVRSRLGSSSEGQAEFFGRRVDTYQAYVSLLIRRGRTAEAFDLAQKTKGRTLLDLLNGGKVSLQQGMSEAEKSQEHLLRTQADQINAQMVKEGAQNEVGAKLRFAALQADLQRAENELAEFTAGLFSKYPGLAQKRSAGTASLAQIASRLPADTVLLEYVASTEPFVFVVTSTGGKPQVISASLGIRGEELTKLSAEFRDALANPAAGYRPISAKLYQALIAPIASRLKGKARLIVCPDGPLWDVSFAALSNGKFLAEQFEIDYAYSATAVDAVLRPRAAPKAENNLLVLANPDFGGAKRFGDNPLVPGQRPIDPPSRPIDPPSRPIEPPSRDLGLGIRHGIVDLPGTQREADSLAQLFPGAKLLTRTRAQESAFTQVAGDYRYVHIASHAFFNDASPMLSSIVLALPNTEGDDGYLTARELFELQLNADLVVLSACNTARGEKKSGEGIVGLSWALFAAGAPAQVVSQWSVDDRATAVLMKRFYRNLKEGRAKGAALREASRSLLDPKAAGNDAKWGHPYYWAPFILLGDWR